MTGNATKTKVMELKTCPSIKVRRLMCGPFHLQKCICKTVTDSVPNVIFVNMTEKREMHSYLPYRIKYSAQHSQLNKLN